MISAIEEIGQMDNTFDSSMSSAITERVPKVAWSAV